MDDEDSLDLAVQTCPHGRVTNTLESYFGIGVVYASAERESALYGQKYIELVLRTVLNNTRESKRDHSAFSKLLDTPFDT